MAIDRIRQLRKSIEKLSTWERTRNAFGFIENKNNPDYLYEFFCAMKILHDLSKNHRITIVQGSKGYIFPMGPGKKTEYARFVVSKNKQELIPMFEFCLGTNIKLSASPSTTFAADISIQMVTNNPNRSDVEDPDESVVILIMDAKYRKPNGAKINISTIREFAQCVADMKVPKSLHKSIQFDKFKELNANCLFTNADVMKEHEQYCKNHGLKQIGHFDCNKSKIKIIG